MTHRVSAALLVCAVMPSCGESTSPVAAGESSTAATTEGTAPGEGEGDDDSGDGDGAATTTQGADDGGSSGVAPPDDDSGDGSDEGTGGGGWDPTAIPVPSAPCPDLAEGWNVFCPAGIEVCREAYVRRGTGTGGPLNLYWHGTYENAVDVQGWGAGAAVLEMTLAEGGLAFYPSADPEAVARPNNPYPWWVVGSSMNDRRDDFFFLDEMIACAAEEGIVDLDRINTGGMSAGGMMTSHLVSRRGYWASAVSWSGGWSVPFDLSQATPTMVIHGGPGDCFGGWCGFMNQSEFFAEQLVELGAFAFLCDHSEGDASHVHHADALGAQGADFMAMAVRGQQHPWDGYPFGEGGDYMLDNYCYAPGTTSPWSPWDN
jgi:hypothetical protein